MLKRNKEAVRKVNELKQKKLNMEISEEEYTQQLSEIKNGKILRLLSLKLLKSKYVNLIDALDEMQICSIGKYVIVDITSGDEFLLKNFESRGGLSQNVAD